MSDQRGFGEGVSLRDYFEDKFKNVEDKIKTGFEGVHERQDIANGRTNKLEVKLSENKEEISALQKWRYVITGALVMLSFIVLNIDKVKAFFR